MNIEKINNTNKFLESLLKTDIEINITLEQLKDYKLDCVIMDHTFGNVDYSFSHLNESLFIFKLIYYIVFKSI